MQIVISAGSISAICSHGPSRFLSARRLVGQDALHRPTGAASA
jgi:hypothetical protein